MLLDAWLVAGDLTVTEIDRGSGEATTTEGSRVFTVVLSGDYDMARHDELRDALCAPTDPVVVADFGAVTFIDSMGLKALINAKRAISEDGRTLVLTALPHNVSRVFHLAGLDRIFEVR